MTLMHIISDQLIIIWYACYLALGKDSLLWEANGKKNLGGPDSCSACEWHWWSEWHCWADGPVTPVVSRIWVTLDMCVFGIGSSRDPWYCICQVRCVVVVHNYPWIPFHSHLTCREGGQCLHIRWPRKGSEIEVGSVETSLHWSKTSSTDKLIK